jgi:hypothetical protein
LAKAEFKKSMLEKLAKKPWIAEHRKKTLSVHGVFTHGIIILVIPEFGVACRRLTPGPGYLEALCEDNVIGLRVYRISQELTTRT